MTTDRPTPAEREIKLPEPRKLTRYEHLAKAVVYFLAACDERHDAHDKGEPLKYTIPYGALNALRDALLNPPVADRQAAQEVERDELAGLRRYLSDTMMVGTVNEQGVARTAIQLLNAAQKGQP